MPAPHLQDDTVLILAGGIAHRIRRCEPMPKGLGFYRMTPLEGPSAGSLEFGLTEREIEMNGIGAVPIH
jgi:hypothetical protein